jgi:hypothetical protein
MVTRSSFTESHTADKGPSKLDIMVTSPIVPGDGVARPALQVALARAFPLPCSLPKTYTGRLLKTGDGFLFTGLFPTPKQDFATIDVAGTQRLRTTY